MQNLSIEDTYKNKNILLLGSSGFVGKVWFAKLLKQLPEIKTIHVLLRKNGSPNAFKRLEKMIGSSYVFKSLHEEYGSDLARYIRDKVIPIDGDVSKPQLGMAQADVARLRKDVDLVVNCAGLVEFNPDIREVISINVEGALNAAAFANSCKNARFLHVSTCYVAGTRQGRIQETIVTDRAPNDFPVDAEHLLNKLKRKIEKVTANPDTSDIIQQVRSHMDKGKARNSTSNAAEKRERHLTQLLIRRRLREQMISLGTETAEEFGWPNTYTLAKWLAEALIKTRFTNLRFAVFRPAIVESAISFPFPGWNEGFNTSGPLAYLLGTWFRYLPSKKGNPFDVIPVDQVCNGLTIAGAALLADKNAEVYQCGSSDRNQFTIDRACELTSLSHRTHYRRSGTTLLETALLSQWDTLSVPKNHLLSVTNFRKLTTGIRSLLEKTTDLPANSIRARIGKASTQFDRKLSQVEKLLELFIPFIHDNRQVFETKALLNHGVEDERFKFAPENIHWRSYWLNTHMPGLRRWCFPQIEGKERERYTPAHPFHLEASDQEELREAS